jgi:hypothetical protein
MRGERDTLAQMIWLIGTCALIWYTVIPEHRRQYLRLLVCSRAREACRRVAWETGRQSMARELDTGTRRYEVPLCASLARDVLARSYDRIRGVTS